MSAGPAEVETLNIFGDVVRSEPGALGEDRFELESRAVVGIEAGLEITRGEDEFADEVFSQVRDDGFLEGGENPVGIPLFLFFPIDLVAGGAEMGDGGENVETFMAFGGEGRVGAGGGVEVEREVLGEDPVVKDVIQQALVAGAEPDGVVGELRVGAIGAEIDQKERHTVAHFLEPAVGPFVTDRRGDFLAVEIGHVGVGDDHLGAEGFPGPQADAGHGVVFHQELVDRGVEAKLAAEILEEFDQGLDQGAGTAHGEVHTPLAFEVVDHGVDGGGLERIPADEERVKGKNFAEALIFHVATGHLPDGAVGTEADQIGSDTEHVGEMGEGLIGEFDEGALEDGVGFADKAAVALEVLGGKAPDFVLHGGLVAGVFEGIAIVPDDPVEGVAGDDLDVVGGFLLVEGEKFIEEKGGGEDGGTGVIGEALVAKDGGPASGLFEGFEESDLISAGLQADGGSQTAESGADDEGGRFWGGVQGKRKKMIRRLRRRRRSRPDRGHQTRW